MHVVEQINNNTPMDFIVPSGYATFVLNADSGLDTVNVRDTSAGVSLVIHGDNMDTVNIGANGSVQGILAPVTVDNPPSYNTININDSADATPRTVGLNTFTSNGAHWGEVYGLAQGAIVYKYADTQSLHITTGIGADNVSVAATGVATYIAGNGKDTINVGNAGSVQSILGDLYVENAPNYNTLFVNDSADATARTVTLSTFTPAGDTAWGKVAGLAPATINYEYADTSGVSIITGTGANTVNVQATGVTTYIRDNGPATVNVGNASSVQGIQGQLDLDNPPNFNTLNIDDSADAAARTVVLTTNPGGNVNWGEVYGLAPAPISYVYGDTSSMHLTTHPSGDTIDVWATGVPTYISTASTGTFGGYDTVNVGSEGSVQGILGALYIYNPPGYTAVNIYDSADTGQRAANLSAFSPGPDPGDWGSIIGLAPASINFSCEDMYNHVVNVSAPLGGNISWTVNPDAYASVIGVNVLLDGYDIN
jgi:hypothetical protein